MLLHKYTANFEVAEHYNITFVVCVSPCLLVRSWTSDFRSIISVTVDGISRIYLGSISLVSALGQLSVISDVEDKQLLIFKKWF